MKATNVIDTYKLREEASSDDLNEAYETLCKSEAYKIGAGIRITSPEESVFFLEVVVPLCRADREIVLSELKGKLGVLEMFEASGYTFKCEKDNSIVCEKLVSEDEIESEYNELERSLENID